MFDFIKKFFVDFRTNLSGYTKSLIDFFNGRLKDALVKIGLKALGLTGGVFTWIATFVIGIVVKKAEKAAQDAADIEEKIAVGEVNKDQYYKDKKDKVPVETLIEDETNLLNGKHHKRP